MMKLFYSSASPYARKCRAVGIEKQLESKIEIVTRAPMENPSDLHEANPLGKVPALILEDGSALYDSPVICEYFDTVGEGVVLLPPTGDDRWRVLRNQALGDGIMDAAVSIAMEKKTREDNEKSEKWIGRWNDAIIRSLDEAEKYAQADQVKLIPDLGNIAIACAIGYIEFRHSHIAWREGRTKLVEWHELFSMRSSMQMTIPS